MLWRNSPPPSSVDEEDDMARKMSVLFTDLHSNTLTKLNNAPKWARVPSALSITHGAVFSQYSSEFLDKNLPEGANEHGTSPEMLKGKLKQEYLEYLRDHCGMYGLYNFLVNFVGSLAKREERKRT